MGGSGWEEDSWTERKGGHLQKGARAGGHGEGGRWGREGKRVETEETGKRPQHVV